MKINLVTFGFIKENCYLIESDNARIVVDPGSYLSEVASFLSSAQNKQRLILLTHAHFDHIGGAKQLSEETDAQIAIGEHDAFGLSDVDYNLSKRFHANVKPFNADLILKDGHFIHLTDFDIEVIETPGHTLGGVCYKIENNLFSGDTLFFESIGRVDHPGGDKDVLLESVYKLFQKLDEDTIVYPGHGQTTTIGHEINNNPFFY